MTSTAPMIKNGLPALLDMSRVIPSKPNPNNGNPGCTEKRKKYVPAVAKLMQQALAIQS